MKKLYFILLLALIATTNLTAQDIPLFSQKLTNSFLYNPAAAGHTVGSATYSFRRSFGNISNAPQTNFVSIHTPIAHNRVGIGANFYQEDVNFLRNSYASAAFAYHLPLSRRNVLSFGVSGEYNFMRLNGMTNSAAEDVEYMKIANGQLNDYDFSFGALFHSSYLKIGLSANRLATAWIKDDKQTILSSYFSGFIQGTIPLRGGQDILEPYVAYRKLSETNNTYDLGLFYTYNNKIMAGAGWRKGSVASLTAGFQITPRLMLGYSREMFLTNIRAQTGSTNEITLRFNFREFDYKSNYVADYKNAVAYRRKTLSSVSRGSKSPAKFHQQQKKFTQYSPNKRYQSIQKHSVTPSSQRTKLSAPKKKAYKKKRRR